MPLTNSLTCEPTIVSGAAAVILPRIPFAIHVNPGSSFTVSLKKCASIKP